MSIEFRCTSCGRLMRTADDTAGKHAKCPACGAMFTIPPAGTTAGGGLPPVQPPAGPPPVTPAAGPSPQPSPALGANPYQSPAGYSAATAAPTPTAAGAVQGTRIDVSDIFSQTVRIFKKECGNCLAGGVLAWLPVMLLVGLVQYLSARLFLQGSNFLGMTVAFVGMLLCVSVAAWIAVGAIRFFLALARGGSPAVGDIFRGGPEFVNLLVLLVLFYLAALAVFAVLAVPGWLIGLISAPLGSGLMWCGMVLAAVALLVLWLMFSQAPWLLVDRGVGVVESLQTSRNLANGNKLTLFAIWLVAAIVQSVLVGIAESLTHGATSLRLGFFVTLVMQPILTLLAAVIYLRIGGQKLADEI